MWLLLFFLCYPLFFLVDCCDRGARDLPTLMVERARVKACKRASGLVWKCCSRRNAFMHTCIYGQRIDPAAGTTHGALGEVGREELSTRPFVDHVLVYFCHDLQYIEEWE